MDTTNAVVDLSHHNAYVDFVALRTDGIFGVIHKATQGLGYVDPTYAPRRRQAQAVGLKWGAYHFGTGADGMAQANFFLKNAQPTPSDLLVLDLEVNNMGPTMTLSEARDFVTRIHAVTGEWPGLYGGSYLKEQLNGQADPVLNNCWLWLSQYGPEAVLPPGWNSWTLWQYTDGHSGTVGPLAVQGVGPCDRNLFQGAAGDLESFWT
jgi:lysozyme